jgi:hypothetical protein
MADYMTIPDAEGQDANGWPTSDFSLVLDNRYVFAWVPGAVNIDPLKFSTNLAGHYRLTFHGEAVVSGAANSKYDRATNTTVADYDIDPASSSFVKLTFFLTRRTPENAQGSGVTGIRLVRKEDVASRQVFTSLWLDSIRKYPWAVLRCMEAMRTNSYGAGPKEAYPHLLDWKTERRLPGSGSLISKSTAGIHSPLSWEDLVTLAQLTHKDLWINVPVNASDDYVDQLARLFKQGDAATGNAGIPADVHLYVEYSNEMWHDVFPQGKWNSQAAQDEVKAGNTNLNYDGASGTAEQWRFRRIAKRTVEIGRQFRNAFSDRPDCIRPVVDNHATEHDFDMLTYVAAQYGKPESVLYGIAQQGYYASADASSPQKVLEGEKAASDKNRGHYLVSRALATYFGLHSLAYEGGPEETGGSDPDVAAPDLPNKLAAARDPGMKNVIVHDLIDNWFAAGGDLYVAFSQVTRYSFYGTFGATEDLSNLQTGKWLGHAEAMQTPVPSPIAGTLLPAVAGESVQLEETQLPGLFLMRVPVAGTYSFSLSGKPGLAFTIDNSITGDGPLQPGLHALFVPPNGTPHIVVMAVRK